MCRSWFNKKEDVQPEITDNTIYHFAAGDYPSYENDLKGPSYDQKRMVAAISSHWDNYTYRKYLDSTTRIKTFFADLEAAVARIQPGGVLVFISDYCFPGTSTDNTSGVRSRIINQNIKVLAERYIQGPDVPDMKTRSTALRNIGAGNYIAMSACPADKTALDVEINGKPGGLYHFALTQTMERGITWKQWTEKAADYIKKLGFDRFPIIEGPDRLINRLIFEDPTQCFILSMHGSWSLDINGDEADGKDEGPYFPDGFICDDKINEIIAKNVYLQ